MVSDEANGSSKSGAVSLAKNNSMLVISGGEGYIDFRVGKDDLFTICTVLVKSVLYTLAPRVFSLLQIFTPSSIIYLPPDMNQNSPSTFVIL